MSWPPGCRSRPRPSGKPSPGSSHTTSLASHQSRTGWCTSIRVLRSRCGCGRHARHRAHVPGGPSIDKATCRWDDPDYLYAHASRSADVVEKWLRNRARWAGRWMWQRSAVSSRCTSSAAWTAPIKCRRGLTLVPGDVAGDRPALVTSGSAPWHRQGPSTSTWLTASGCPRLPAGRAAPRGRPRLARRPRVT